MTPRKRVLFVCLGNICRSPAAEGIFKTMLERSGLGATIDVDSAGTGDWHEGDGPDDRMIRQAAVRGYDLRALEARQIRAPHDLRDFDLILTMDESNLKNVNALDIHQEYQAKIRPLASYCRRHQVSEVPDPYYQGPDGFEHVLDLLEDACTELLGQLQTEAQA